MPELPGPFPAGSSVDHCYPHESHTLTAPPLKSSFHHTENSPFLSISLERETTTTVQQALAHQIKKRIENEKQSQTEGLLRNNSPKEGENYASNEAVVKTSGFQDQSEKSILHTSDFQHQNAGNFERESFKTAAFNDLSSPFKCKQCEKVFTQRIQLQMHVCPKSPYKPFQCGHCLLSFAQPSELRNHVVVHSSERPFKCGFCGRSFAGATTLNNHVRTHTGERPFACKTCGKTFAIATQLARHTRVPGECLGHVSSTVGSAYPSESLVGND